MAWEYNKEYNILWPMSCELNRVYVWIKYTIYKFCKNKYKQALNSKMWDIVQIYNIIQFQLDIFI